MSQEEEVMVVEEQWQWQRVLIIPHSLLNRNQDAVRCGAVAVAFNVFRRVHLNVEQWAE